MTAGSRAISSARIQDQGRMPNVRATSVVTVCDHHFAASLLTSCLTRATSSSPRKSVAITFPSAPIKNVAGIALTPYTFAIGPLSAFSAQSCVQVIPFLAAYSRAVFASLSKLILTITSRPSPADCSHALFTFGISATQGAHHVAQKSINTTLPRNSDSLNGFSSSVVAAKSGASTPEYTPRTFTFATFCSSLLCPTGSAISCFQETSRGEGPQVGAAFFA